MSSLQIRKEQDVGEGKGNMGGNRECGVWVGEEEGEQLKEIVGLVGEPSKGLARTVVEGLKRMRKKREE